MPFADTRRQLLKASLAEQALTRSRATMLFQTFLFLFFFLIFIGFFFFFFANKLRDNSGKILCTGNSFCTCMQANCY